MSANDVYQIIDTQEAQGQKALNVYFYQVDSSFAEVTNAADVVTAFIEQVLPDVVAAQNIAVTHTSVKALNIFDETDVHEELISEQGEIDADLTSMFDAYGFRLVGSNGAVRAGAKRVVGVSETATSNGVVDNPTQLGLLNDLATTLALTLVAGTLGLDSLFPVIVKRILDSGVYRLPTSLGEATISTVTDALFTPLVTSQVSRKIGVGE